MDGKKEMKSTFNKLLILIAVALICVAGAGQKTWAATSAGSALADGIGGENNTNLSDGAAMEVLAASEAKTPDSAKMPQSTSGNNLPDDEPTPTSTNEFIMVGGNWITPVATYGRTVNVVLPVVNMSTTHLTNVVVTPVIASNTSEWPFEIETSGYTQTIPDLPGRGNGQSDMDRRRELTWTFKTRSDVLNGYYKVPFNVIY